ncbi:MAG: right-handed parallel beta-helix repeat-containing protein [Candidatus Woesearchaeota archaeon]|nr:MAG: right-handed parallel beta-helix repeat-containing protein [Candidatus Woesearchaeota archaeon]
MIDRAVFLEKKVRQRRQRLHDLHHLHRKGKISEQFYREELIDQFGPEEPQQNTILHEKQPSHHVPLLSVFVFFLLIAAGFLLINPSITGFAVLIGSPAADVSTYDLDFATNTSTTIELPLENITGLGITGWHERGEQVDVYVETSKGTFLVFSSKEQQQETPLLEHTQSKRSVGTVITGWVVDASGDDSSSSSEGSSSSSSSSDSSGSSSSSSESSSSDSASSSAATSDSSSSSSGDSSDSSTSSDSSSDSSGSDSASSSSSSSESTSSSSSSDSSGSGAESSSSSSSGSGSESSSSDSESTSSETSVLTPVERPRTTVTKVTPPPIEENDLGNQESVEEQGTDQTEELPDEQIDDGVHETIEETTQEDTTELTEELVQEEPVELIQDQETQPRRSGGSGGSSGSGNTGAVQEDLSRNQTEEVLDNQTIGEGLEENNNFTQELNQTFFNNSFIENNSLETISNQTIRNATNGSVDRNISLDNLSNTTLNNQTFEFNQTLNASNETTIKPIEIISNRTNASLQPILHKVLFKQVCEESCIFSPTSHPKLIIKTTGQLYLRSVSYLTPNNNSENTSFETNTTIEVNASQYNLPSAVDKPVQWVAQLDRAALLSEKDAREEKKSRVKESYLLSVPHVAYNFSLGEKVSQNKLIIANDTALLPETVTYNTPAPIVSRTPTEFGERVRVSSPLLARSITASANITANISLESVSVVEIKDGKRIPLSFTVYDDDYDSYADRVEWLIDELTNNTYEVGITVLNVYTYPKAGDNWTVYFNTTGIADLTIWSTNANFTEMPTDVVATDDELRFLDFRCGNQTVNDIIVRDAFGQEYVLEDLAANIKPVSFFLPSYSCENISMFTTSVRIPGYAALGFRFGTVEAYAYDPVWTLQNIASGGVFGQNADVVADPNNSSFINAISIFDSTTDNVYNCFGDDERLDCLAIEASGYTANEDINNNQVLGLVHLASDAKSVRYCNTSVGRARTWDCGAVVNVGGYYADADVALNDTHIGVVISNGAAKNNNYIVYCQAPITTNSFSCETVYSATDSTGSPAIAIDSTGMVHLAFRDVSNTALRYCNGTYGSWTCELALNGADDGYSPAIAISYDYEQIPTETIMHMTSQRGSVLDLYYCVGSYGSWSCEAVETSNNIGYYSSVVVDQSQEVHISHRDNTQSALRYCNGTYSTSWDCQEVHDPVNSVGAYSSIAMHPNGKIYIAYQDATAKDLLLAVYEKDTLDFDIGPTITPTSPKTNDTLICNFNVTGEATITANISWYENDGGGYTELTNLAHTVTANDGINTTSALNITWNVSKNGYQYKCGVVLDDGQKSISQSNSSAVTIGNYSTSIQATLNNTLPRTGDVVLFQANYTVDNGFGDPSFGTQIKREIWKTNTGSNMYSIRIFDQDGDGRKDEIIFPEYGDLRVFNENGSETSVVDYPNAAPSYLAYGVRTFDPNQDGQEDIIKTEQFTVEIYYGNNGTALWESSPLALGVVYFVVVGDFDGDTIVDDFIYGNLTNIYMYATDDGQSWSQQWTDVQKDNYALREFLVGDVNNDGVDDFVLQEYGSAPAYTMVYNGSNGARLWNATDDSWSAAADIGDVNGDGIIDTIFRAGNGDIYWYDVNGGTIDSSAEPNGVIQEVSFADLDLDGVADEIIVADSGNSATDARIWAFDNGSTKLWNYTVSHIGDYDYMNALRVGDINDDGLPEIIFANENTTNFQHIYVLNSSGNFSWLYFDNHGNFFTYWDDSPTLHLADINRDGISDIVFSTVNAWLGVIQDVNCSANVDGVNYPMQWNNASDLFEVGVPLSTPGETDYSVSCSKGGYDTATTSSYFLVNSSDCVQSGNWYVTQNTVCVNISLALGTFNLTTGDSLTLINSTLLVTGETDMYGDLTLTKTGATFLDRFGVTNGSNVHMSNTKDSIWFNNDVYFDNGSTITWSNVTVHFNTTSDNAFGLYVDNGTTLVTANNTVVTRGATNNYYTVDIRGDSTIDISNTWLNKSGSAVDNFYVNATVNNFTSVNMTFMPYVNFYTPSYFEMRFVDWESVSQAAESFELLWSNATILDSSFLGQFQPNNVSRLIVNRTNFSNNDQYVVKVFSTPGDGVTIDRSLLEVSGLGANPFSSCLMVNNAGTVTVINSSCIHPSQRYSIFLGNNQFTINLLNASFNESGLADFFGTGTVNVQKYFTAYIEDSLGTPLSGVTIEVNNSGDTVVLSKLTNADGYTNKGVITPYTIDNAGIDIDYRNFTVGASKPGYRYNFSNQSISQSLFRFNPYILTLTPDITIQYLDITPDPAFTANNLLCNFTINSTANEAMNVSVYWFNGSTQKFVKHIFTSPPYNSTYNFTLGSGNTSRTNTWWCKVNVTGNVSRANTQVNTSITISNTPPPAPVMVSNLDNGHQLQHFPLINFTVGTDDDGDTIYTISQTNDITWLQQNMTTGVSSHLIGYNQTLTDGVSYGLRLRNFDGQAYSVSYSAIDAFIMNSLPSITGVTVTDPAYTNSTINCSPSGWSDGQGDAAQYYYRWFFDDVFETQQGPTSNNGSLDCGAVGGCDEAVNVTCTVIPYDGYENGTLKNDSVIVSNIAPEIPTVNVHTSNRQNETDETLQCNATITDQDSDDLNITLRWYNDAVLVNTTYFNNSYASGSLFLANLSYTYTSVGENWTCSLRLDDGDAMSAWANSSNLTILQSTVTCGESISVPGHYVVTSPVAGYDNSGAPCIDITSSDVELDCQGNALGGVGDIFAGLNIKGTSSVYLDNITAGNCSFADFGYAFDLQYVANSHFEEISGSGSAEGPDYLLDRINDSWFVKANSSGGDDGFWVTNSYRNSFERINVTSSAGSGMYFTANSFNNNLYNSSFTGESIKDLTVYSCSLTLQNVTGEENLPIALYNKTSTISGWNNNVSMLILCNADNSVVANSSLVVTSNINSGLYLYLTDDATISNVSLGGFKYDVELTSSHRNRITNITSQGAATTGYYISSSINNTLSNVSSFSAGSYGLYLASSRGTVVANSTFQDAGTRSIALTSAGLNNPNRLYNNLFNSTTNEFIGGTSYVNYWNTTEGTGNRVFGAGTKIGGNYWATPTGTGYSETCVDGNADGICDTDKTLDGNNVDYAPLAGDVNAAPYTGAVSLTTSGGTNLTSQELHCAATIYDANNDDMNVTVKWFLNDRYNHTAYYWNGYGNNSALVINLSNTLTTFGDNWSCAMRVYDGTNYSAWNASSNLEIVIGHTNLSIYEMQGTPTGPFDPSLSEGAEVDYFYMNASDDRRWKTDLNGTNNTINSQVYVYNLSANIYNASAIDNITLSWEGFGDNYSGYTVNISLWNWTSNAWVQLNYSESGAATEFSLNSPVVSGGSYYVNASTKEVAVLVEGEKVSFLSPLGSTSAGSGPASLDGAFGLYVVGTIAYVTSYDDFSLSLIDVSNPAGMGPRDDYVDNAPPGSVDTSQNVFVKDNIAYVVSLYDDSLTLVNVSNPDAITFLDDHVSSASPYSLDYADAIMVVGDVAYVTSQIDDSVTLVNVSNPSAIVPFENYTTATPPYSVDGANVLYVNGDYVYVVGDNDYVFTVLNASDPSNLVGVGQYLATPTSILTSTEQMVYENNYVYVSVSFSTITDAISIFELSNPANPVFVGNYSKERLPYSVADAEGLAISGNYLFASSYDNDSVTVLDVANPANPVPIFQYVDSAEPYSLDGVGRIFLLSGKLYTVSSIDNAIAVFAVHDNFLQTDVLTLDVREGNSPPPAPSSVSLRTATGNNWSYENLNCSTTISDPNGDALNVTVFWNKDGVFNQVRYYNNSYANGTSFSAALASGNTSVGDNWNCSVRLDDGTGLSGFTNSTNLSVTNAVTCGDTIGGRGDFELKSSVDNYAAGNCLTINAANVSLDCQGNYVDGTGASFGIYVLSSSYNATVNNCVAKEFNYNIYVLSSDYAHIYNSEFYNGTTYGIRFVNSDNVSFENVSSHGNTQYGLSMIAAAYSNFTNVSILRNQISGVAYSSGSRNTFKNSRFLNNTQYDFYITGTATCTGNNLVNVNGTDNKPIVYVNTSRTIQGWNNNLSQLILCNADGASVTDVLMDHTDKENNGISLVETDSATITNVTVRDTYNGLEITSSSSSNEINDSAFVSNANYGITVTSSSKPNDFKNVTSTYNADDGMYVSVGTSSFINVFQSNFSNNGDEGLYLSGLSYGGYYNNTFTNNLGSGMFVSNTDIISIYNNWFANNTNYGLELSSSGGPGMFELITIYNNFFNNTNNVAAGSGYNAWNTSVQTGNRIYGSGVTIGGNFWANSTGGFSQICADDDNDGICDDTYSVAKFDDDYHALSSGYSPHTAPTTPTPEINSTDGTNLTTQDLHCFDTISDYDYSDMNVTVTWHKNGLLNRTDYYNNSYPDDSTVVFNLSSGNLSVGDIWNCSMRLDDGTNQSAWGNSTGLTILNLGPTTPTPWINATSRLNASDEDFHCNATIVDPDDDDLNVTVWWYKGGVFDQVRYYNSSFASGSLIVVNLTKSNITQGDQWICSMRLDDGTSQSSFGNSSALVATSPYPTVTWESTTPSQGEVSYESYAGLNTTTTDALETSAILEFNDDVMAYWSFDYTNSSGAYGNSSNPRFASFAYGLSVSDLVPGKRGTALNFDGTNDHLRITDRLVRNNTEITFMTWFKTSANGVILGYQNTAYPTNPANWVPIIYVGTDGKLRGEYWIGGQNPITTAGTVNDSQWHHVALVGETTTQRMYLDGVYVGTLNGAINHLSMNYNHIGIGFGTSWPNAGAGWFAFNGDLDEVVFHKRALTVEEINASYNNGLYRLHHNFTGLSNADYNFSAIVIDAGGNMTVANRSYTVLIDPLVEIYKNASTATLSVDTIYVNWSAVDGSGLDTVLFNVTYPNGTVIFSSTDATGDINLTPQNLTVTGLYSINLQAIDTDANMMSTSDTFSVLADTTPPVITWLSPTPVDGSSRTLNHATLNTSISDSLDTSAFFDWDGSLVAYYNFEYVNTTGVKDNSSNNNFGRFTDGLSINDVAPAMYGNGLYFDGTNNHLEFPTDSGPLSGTGPFTVSFWLQTNGTGTWQTILQQRDEITTGQYSVLVRATGPIYFYDWSGSYGFQLNSASSVDDGEWHHVVVVRESSTAYVYIDGSLDNSTGGTARNILSARDLAVGYDIRDSNKPFEGMLDELIIWNTNLTAAEISSVYNNTVNRLYRNQSDLSPATYSYSAWAIDGAGNIATSSREVTVDPGATTPDTPLPGINSTDGSNATGQDLHCFAQVNDPNGNDTNVTVRWYLNGVLDRTDYYNNSYANEVAVDTVLGYTNTSVGDNWSCAMRLDDGAEFSGWGYSVNLTVVTVAPTTPSPQLRSENGMNSSNEYLNCSATIYDSDLDNLNVSVRWFKDGVLDQTRYYNNDYPSSQAFYAILTSDNTSVGENWNCSIQLDDGVYQSSWGNSTNLSIVNSDPSVNKPVITPSNPNATQNLTCSFTITDSNPGETLWANVSWFKNDAYYSSANESGQTSGVGDSSILHYAHTSFGESWNCTVTPYDGNAGSGSTNYSDAVSIGNSLPSIPVLDYPDNESTITNRFPTFNWTASTDADGDDINYTVNLTAPSGLGCYGFLLNSSQNINNYTTTTELCTLAQYSSGSFQFQVRACDFYGCSNFSSPHFFNVTNVVSISLVTNETDFSNLNPGVTDDSTDDDPSPMVIRNDGNVRINVSINATQSFFVTEELNTSYFQYKADQDEASSFNTTGSSTSWLNVTNVSTRFIHTLQYNDTKDQAQVDFKITIPTYETPGIKSTLIVFLATADNPP